jgi:hypothetical protein
MFMAFVTYWKINSKSSSYLEGNERRKKSEKEAGGVA